MAPAALSEDALRHADQHLLPLALDFPIGGPREHGQELAERGVPIGPHAPPAGVGRCFEGGRHLVHARRRHDLAFEESAAYGACDIRPRALFGELYQLVIFEVSDTCFPPPLGRC